MRADLRVSRSGHDARNDVIPEGLEQCRKASRGRSPRAPTAKDRARRTLHRSGGRRVMLREPTHSSAICEIVVNTVIDAIARGAVRDICIGAQRRPRHLRPPAATGRVHAPSSMRAWASGTYFGRSWNGCRSARLTLVRRLTPCFRTRARWYVTRSTKRREQRPATPGSASTRPLTRCGAASSAAIRVHRYPIRVKRYPRPSACRSGYLARIPRS